MTPSGPQSGCFLGEFFFEIFEISETLDMSFKHLVEMFEGDSADTCVGKFTLMSLRGQEEVPACADLGSKTPIGVSEKSINTNSIYNCTLDF